MCPERTPPEAARTPTDCVGPIANLSPTSTSSSGSSCWKLDVSVIQGLISRRERARAAASIPVEERRRVAGEIAHELVENQRDLRIIKTIERLLWAIQGF